MGLYAKVDLSEFVDFGNAFVEQANGVVTSIYYDKLEDLDSGSGQDEEGIQWDDMEEAEADWSSTIDDVAFTFQRVFMETIHQLCPVRTGYLISTIHCEYDRYTGEIECYAEADYAQYVEYGTYKMDAQPYFEPALRAAIEEAQIVAETSIQRITENLQEEMIEYAEWACDSVGPSIAAIMLAIFLLSLLIMMIELLCQLISESMLDYVSSALEECLDVLIY